LGQVEYLSLKSRKLLLVLICVKGRANFTKPPEIYKLKDYSLFQEYSITQFPTLETLLTLKTVKKMQYN